MDAPELGAVQGGLDPAVPHSDILENPLHKGTMVPLGSILKTDWKIHKNIVVSFQKTAAKFQRVAENSTQSFN